MTMQLDGIEWKDEVGVILHIGAGYGGDLAALQALPATRILLVEPNSGCLPELRNAARQDARIEVIEAAVSTMPTARAPLHVFNIEAQSSLRTPTDALRTLFPALRQIAAPEVALISPEALLAQALPDGVRGGLAIIDAPGETGALLEGLLAAGLAGRVEYLLLRLSREVLFEGGTDAGTVLETAREGGYQLLSSDEADSDFPVYLLRVDIVARALGAKLLRVEGEVAERDAQIAELSVIKQSVEQRVQEQASDLEATRATLRQKDAQIARMRGQIENSAQGVREKTESLEAVRAKLDAQVEASAERQKEQADRIAELEAMLYAQKATAEAQLVALEASLAANLERIAALEVQGDARGAELEAARTRIAELDADRQAVLTERELQSAEMKGELEAARERIEDLIAAEHVAVNSVCELEFAQVER
ncbi:hypothetical protein C357_21367, partial [Citreicella sp. 357]